MKVNRYTQYTPAEYNPRTLEELMVAPMYMRQQHDAMDLGIAESQAALAQIDYEDFMDPVVSKEKERLNAELQAQAEALANEGFNNSTKGRFLKYNKDYQSAIGPKGPIGKAQKYSEQYLKDRELAIANAIQRGHDPVATVEQLDEQYKNWSESFDGKNLRPFKAINAPNYKDLMTDIKDFKAIHGYTVSTENGEEGYNIIPDEETGKLVAVTSSGKIITKDNNAQLAAAIDLLSDDWLTEQGAGYKSDQWNKIDTDFRRRQLGNYKEVLRDTSTQDSTGKNYQFMNQSTDSSNGKIADGGLYVQKEEMVDNEVSELGYEKSLEKINDLKASGDASSIARAREMEEIIYNADMELEDNEDYQQKNNQLNSIKSNLINDLEAYGANPTLISAINNATFINPVSTTIFGKIPGIEIDGVFHGLSLNMRDKDGSFDKVINKVKSIKEQFNKLSPEVSKIKNEAVANIKSQYTSFQIDKTKAKGNFLNINTKQIATNISTDGAIGNNYGIDSFWVGIDGDRETLVPGKEDKKRKEIFEAMARSNNQGNVEMTKVYPKGSKGLPMIELSFPVPKDSSLGKEGENVLVRVTLDNFYKTGDADPVTDLMLRSIEELGGISGMRLAQNMRAISIFKDIKPSGKPTDFSQSSEIKRSAPLLNDIFGAASINIARHPDDRSFNIYKRTGENETLGDNTPVTWGQLIGNNNILSLGDNYNNFENKIISMFIDEYRRMPTVPELKMYFDSIEHKPASFDSKEDLLTTFTIGNLI